MLRIVGVVVPDTLPEIAVRLVETLAENPAACLDIRAEIVPQRVERCGFGRVPMGGDLRNPDLVDLHRSDIDGRVGVLADAPE